MKIKNAVSITMLGALCAISASGQASRTFVSGTGNDSNACSRNSPCATFSGALSKTFSGGEINVLDPGDFGSATITQSVTIDTGEDISGPLSGSTTGIVINGSGIAVTLRGIEINGTGSGVAGVSVLNAASVHIDRSRIWGNNAGISVTPGVNTTTLTVTDTVVHDCSGSNSLGIDIDGSAVTAVLSNVKVYDCATGLNAATSSKVAARNVNFSSNTTGVAAAGSSTVTLDTAVVSYTTTAIQAGGTSAIRLINSSIVDNTTGLSATGGSIISFDNNRIKGNGTDGNPTTTYFQR